MEDDVAYCEADAWNGSAVNDLVGRTGHHVWGGRGRGAISERERREMDHLFDTYPMLRHLLRS